MLSEQKKVNENIMFNLISTTSNNINDTLNIFDTENSSLRNNDNFDNVNILKFIKNKGAIKIDYNDMELIKYCYNNLMDDNYRENTPIDVFAKEIDYSNQNEYILAGEYCLISKEAYNDRITLYTLTPTSSSLNDDIDKIIKYKDKNISFSYD